MPGTEKSDGAFRTIREVADWLAVPTHVLRFWESKFDQIAPVKGSGGRRYYRPEDMRLLGGIKVMLHDQGFTVRGVSQRIEEEGADAVMGLSPDLDAVDGGVPRARRVIRTGDDIAQNPADGIAPAPSRTETPTPGPAPEDENGAQPDEEPAGEPPRQPDVPREETDPPQPIDVTAPPQPVEIPARAPDEPPEPVPENATDAAPGSDPEPVATDERAVPPEPWEASVCADGEEGSEPDRGSDDPPEEPEAVARLSGLETRRLRRIVRKLRGLIEEVEEDLDPGRSR